MFLLASCGGGGGSDTAGTNGLAGTYIKNNPGVDEYINFNGASVTYLAGSCTVTGSFTSTANTISVIKTSSTSSCGSIPGTFSCSYFVNSSSSIDVNCGIIAGTFSR